jgi:hypothetical protein
MAMHRRKLSIEALGVECPRSGRFHEVRDRGQFLRLGRGQDLFGQLSDPHESFHRHLRHVGERLQACDVHRQVIVPDSAHGLGQSLFVLALDILVLEHFQIHRHLLEGGGFLGAMLESGHQAGDGGVQFRRGALQEQPFLLDRFERSQQFRMPHSQQVDFADDLLDIFRLIVPAAGHGRDHSVDIVGSEAIGLGACRIAVEDRSVLDPHTGRENGGAVLADDELIGDRRGCGPEQQHQEEQRSALHPETIEHLAAADNQVPATRYLRP